MKPLRASLVAGCLHHVLESARKVQCAIDINGSVGKKVLFGKKILVVDDNKVNRIVAVGALKRLEAEVECADSGKAALALLKPPHHYDVCFMDIQIPEMDGFEVTRRIRLMESSTYNNDGLAASGVGSSLMSKRHMPILAMTAGVIHSTHEDQKRIDPGHFECHWVIFTFDDGLAKYNLNLDTTNTGALVPAKNVQYLERKWCILKPSAKLDYTLVGDSVSYACGLDLLTASASGTEHLARIWMRLAMHPMPSTVTSKLTTRTILPASSRTLE